MIRLRIVLHEVPERTQAHASFLLFQEVTIKKNRNTFAKLQRERKKKQKADEKRQRKLERKAMADDPMAMQESSEDVEGSEDDESSEDSDAVTDTANDEQ